MNNCISTFFLIAIRIVFLLSLNGVVSEISAAEQWNRPNYANVTNLCEKKIEVICLFTSDADINKAERIELQYGQRGDLPISTHAIVIKSENRIYSWFVLDQDSNKRGLTIKQAMNNQEIIIDNAVEMFKVFLVYTIDDQTRSIGNNSITSLEEMPKKRKR